MQTIIYQGREVRATLVNYLSGTIPTTTVDHDGDEELFRDERGCYYLRRTLNLLDSESEQPKPASGRTLTHRINVNAAILWATTRLNSDTLDLRNDAAILLMEGRGYQDPHPSHLSVEQRAMVLDPDRFASPPANRLWQRGTARGGSPEEVTVAVTMPLALYRRILAMAYWDSNNTNLDVSARIIESMEGDVEAWQQSGDTNPTSAAYLREFEQELDAGLYPTVYPPPLAMTLDPEAARLGEEAA